MSHCEREKLAARQLETTHETGRGRMCEKTNEKPWLQAQPRAPEYAREVQHHQPHSGTRQEQRRRRGRQRRAAEVEEQW